MLVADKELKDVEGLGECTLEEVKTEWVRTLGYCSSDGRLTAEGASARLANFPCTGRIVIDAGLDSALPAGASPTPC